MAFVTCLIYYVLTVFIPLKLSYTAVNDNKDTKLWAIYWAIFTFFSALFYVAPFLE